MSRDGWLPPGVEHSDIPGNRPEDAEWDRLHEWIDEEFGDRDPREVRRLIEAAAKEENEGE